MVVLSGCSVANQLHMSSRSGTRAEGGCLGCVLMEDCKSPSEPKPHHTLHLKFLLICGICYTCLPSIGQSNQVAGSKDTNQEGDCVAL